jgi:hypothetical protein
MKDIWPISLDAHLHQERFPDYTSLDSNVQVVNIGGADAWEPGS